MWIPPDTAAIEEAAQRDDLEETPSFDAKRELPASAKRNVDVAIDVAAMSTEGGVLLYGIAEDDNERPTILAPFPLAGAADRIGEIVAKSIAEVPYIDVREYHTADDETVGYLAVIVPQSARAPHQVTVGDDRRFYGRGAKGNRRLSEGEIALLYQRRLEWEQDRDVLLAEAVQSSRYTPQADVGYIYAFAYPIAPSREIWTRAVAASGDRDALLTALQEAAVHAPIGPNQSEPKLGPSPHWARDGADAWRLSSHRTQKLSDEAATAAVEITVNADGRGLLFSGRAAERINPQTGPDPNGILLLYEDLIAGNVAAFFAFMGALYRTAGYFGHVDVGLIVRQIEGAHSWGAAKARGNFAFIALEDRPSYSGPTYPRTERLAAAELDDPASVTLRMLHPLFEATTGRDDYDPFT